MPGSTSLRLITTPQQRQVTERLWQLYYHDLSEFRGSMPDSEGLYKPGRLPTFFEDPDRCGYLIYSDQAPAGFALIRGLTKEQKVVGEFFVIRAVRRQRVGHEAATALLRLHPGRWGIPFQEENQGAARFWRRVAADAAGAAREKEERLVPGKPGTPPDTWLLLSTRLRSFRSDRLIPAGVRSGDGPLSVRAQMLGIGTGRLGDSLRTFRSSWGLRIFEVTGADITDLGEDHGHQVLRVRQRHKGRHGSAAARGSQGHRPGSRITVT